MIEIKTTEIDLDEVERMAATQTKVGNEIVRELVDRTRRAEGDLKTEQDKNFEKYDAEMARMLDKKDKLMIENKGFRKGRDSLEEDVKEKDAANAKLKQLMKDREAESERLIRGAEGKIQDLKTENERLQKELDAKVESPGDAA